MASRVLLLMALAGCATSSPPAPAPDAIPPDGPALAPDAQAPRADARPADTAPTLTDAGPPAGGTSGCGKPAQGTSSYVRRTIMIRGVSREYFLYLPRSYDPRRMYPLVFRWHGAGGNGTSGGLEIESSSKEDAIIASPSGLQGRWSQAVDGPDVELFDTLVQQLGAELCLDTGRVFSYGFSAGGAFTNLLACVRGTVLRGAAPVAGRPEGMNCNAQVAAILVHGAIDDTVPVADGVAARERYRVLNGCSTTSQSDPPPPCVRYQGCPPRYPVVWCQTAIGHDPMGAFSGPAAWAFFKSLP
jgi:polyhydroxybutyrate depolymerase